jgi:hypothetical protein
VPLGAKGAAVPVDPTRKEVNEMHKDELHGYVVKLCSDEQLDAAINRHHNSRRCGRCNQPLGALLVSQGKTTRYDCN